MVDFTITLGYAPTRRDGEFPDPAYAIANEKSIRKNMMKILEQIGKVKLITIDWLNEEGILVDPMDADSVSEKMQEEKVDALFIPHANFGSEEAVARLAKKLNVPVLLWGPLDTTFPERMTDSQCGMFATSMALNRFQIPFTYIPNCAVDDRAFAEGLERFIRVASVVKAFRIMRIGQVCVRPQSFLSVRYSEAELAEKFGIETVVIDSTELEKCLNYCLTECQDEIDQRVQEIKSLTNTSQMDADRLRRKNCQSAD